MATNAADRWAEWVIRGRWAGRDSAQLERMERELTATRDRILDGADLRHGDVVLDAGCGTGLLTFGALDRIGTAGRVIAVDVSADALDELRRIASDLTVADRIELHTASLLELPVETASVDAVVDRSVLIYVDDKPAAAHEYARVLRSRGRVSIFEPINAEARHEYGFDLGLMRELHERVEARKQAETNRACRSMVDFDADDLRRAFEEAGFSSVQVELGETEWATSSGEEWRSSLDRAPNPLWPPAVDLVRDALGVQTDAYLSFMVAGIERHGYRLACPAAFLTAER